MIEIVSGYEIYESQFEEVEQYNAESSVKSMCGACAFRDDCEYVGLAQECPLLGGIEVSADQVRLVNYCGRCKQCSEGATKDVAPNKNSVKMEVHCRDEVVDPQDDLKHVRVVNKSSDFGDNPLLGPKHSRNPLARRVMYGMTKVEDSRIRAPQHTDSNGKLPCFFSGKCRLHSEEVEHVDHLRLKEFQPFDPKPLEDSEFTNNITAEPSESGEWQKITIFSGAT